MTDTVEGQEELIIEGIQEEIQAEEQTTQPLLKMSTFLGKDISPLTQPRTEDEIEAIGISVPKEDRALLK